MLVPAAAAAAAAAFPAFLALPAALQAEPASQPIAWLHIPYPWLPGTQREQEQEQQRQKHRV
jgi:hypothetical protein